LISHNKTSFTKGRCNL